MGFYRRVKYFLVHTLKLSNKEAQELIDSGAVKTNGVTITENCTITDDSEIQVNDKIVRKKKEFVYILFYKPAGFESTLNTRIEKNLSPFFKEYPDLAIAGRLDKQSEGLLLLSNDGKWIENLHKCLQEQLDDNFNQQSRHPGTVVLLLRDLIDLRLLLRHFYAGQVDYLNDYIIHLAPIVRHLRHGDESPRQGVHLHPCRSGSRSS